MTISEILASSITKLNPKTAEELAVTRLELLALLAKVTGLPNSSLVAWPDKQLTSDEVFAFKGYLTRLANSEPLAYILENQPFCDIELYVNANVLIPRADTETLVTAATTIAREHNFPKPTLLDLGTGSGAVALAIAKVLPKWSIHAVDISQAALDVAKLNFAKYNLSNIQAYISDWFSECDQKFSIIVANPPYIAPADPHLDKLSYEPELALVAAENGLKCIQDIINASDTYLEPGGFILFEHGMSQASSVKDKLHLAGFREVRTIQDLSGKDRVTIASKAKSSA